MSTEFTPIFNPPSSRFPPSRAQLPSISIWYTDSRWTHRAVLQQMTTLQALLSCLLSCLNPNAKMNSYVASFRIAALLANLSAIQKRCARFIPNRAGRAFVSFGPDHRRVGNRQRIGGAVNSQNEPAQRCPVRRYQLFCDSGNANGI